VTRYNDQRIALAINALFRMYATLVIDSAFKRLQDPTERRFVLL